MHYIATGIEGPICVYVFTIVSTMKQCTSCRPSIKFKIIIVLASAFALNENMNYEEL